MVNCNTNKQLKKENMSNTNRYTTTSIGNNDSDNKVPWYYVIFTFPVVIIAVPVIICCVYALIVIIYYSIKSIQHNVSFTGK
jgi:hypothetical protein